MDKSQKGPENVKQLLSEFYEIIQEDLEENTPTKICLKSYAINQACKQKNLNPVEEPPQTSAKSISNQDLCSLAKVQQGEVYFSGGDQNEKGKLLQTCSTEGMESRRRNWEEQELREIVERRESEEGSHSQSQYGDKIGQFEIEKGEKNKQFRLGPKKGGRQIGVEQNTPSPWQINDCSDYTCRQMSQRKQLSFRKKRTKKNANRKVGRQKQQLKVNLEYGEKEKRCYKVGMKDLNRQWFTMLNGIHQKVRRKE